MAIKIQTEKPVIPIEIGNVKLEFEISDENIKRLYESQEKYKEELKNLEGEDFDAAKEAVKKALDFFLGEGAFDKIYEISPSIILITKYFWQIVEGLEEELIKKAGSTQQQKAKKYLAAKQRHSNLASPLV
ncbi:hypothetical protein [Bacillus sp. JJ1562]|uniref:hypothetical protein n=1 Tax=Bacillus sp. JJ1562 TaxID=3122960 RepID=UPI0030035731